MGGGGGGRAGSRVDAALGQEAPKDEEVRFPPPALFQRSGSLWEKFGRMKKTEMTQIRKRFQQDEACNISHIILMHSNPREKKLKVIICMTSQFSKLKLSKFIICKSLGFE